MVTGVNLNSTLTPSRARQAFGLVVASLILGGSLTACGSDAENTTCGELKGKSTDEVIDLFKDAAEEEDDKDIKEALKAVEDFDDTQRESFSDALKAQCDGEDDDTKLGDL